MAGTSTTNEDHTRLSLSDRLLFRAESVMNLLGGVVIFLLVLLATANVAGRYLFSTPVDGYIDWVEQAMAFIAFLGLAYTQRLGGHIRMDIVVGRLRGRMLWVSELLSVILMLITTLILVYGSYLHFLRAYQIGDSSLDINLPTWPAKLVVPFALSVLALRLVVQLWAYARAIRTGETRPVGVPLVESPAEVAAREAATLFNERGERRT
jgi:TRAP-type C4-dicarboxylate transport system permease small subunit